jgi:hypothetical protein
LKQKYAPVLDFIAEPQVQLQNLNVQDDRLLIRATMAFGSLKQAHSEKTDGDRSRSTRILEANRDRLSDPNRLQPGQVLTIPALQ